MQGMKNIFSMGLLWMRQWSSWIRKRRVTHSNSARYGFLFCKKCSHVLVKITPFRLVKDYGGTYCLVLGLLALKKMKGETSQMTWIFTSTAERISPPPPTVVPKRRQEITDRRCVKSQKSAGLSYCFRSLKSRNYGRVTFLLSAGCFLCCAVHVIFKYTKIIPQQVKGKKKWAEIHHLLKLFVTNIHS